MDNIDEKLLELKKELKLEFILDHSKLHKEIEKLKIEIKKLKNKLNKLSK